MTSDPTHFPPAPGRPRDGVAVLDPALRGRPGPHPAPDGEGPEPEPRLTDFRSSSPRMGEFLELVHRIKDSDASLLITGETGVGKERLARAIHAESPRAAAPFVSVNCGALPDALLESELFGHEAGAFTGAERRRKGRFELADGGTIFLDEIGEMPPHLQVKLLTVLQRRMVQRIGSDKPLPIDVRVMSATNRDLSIDIERGRLREDLYYRLNVVHLDVPPLRARPEDMPDLVGSFLVQFRASLKRPKVEGLTDEALEALVGYPWPGNVRELRNVLERAILIARSSQIGLEDLPVAVRSAAGAPPAQPRGLPDRAASKAPPSVPGSTYTDLLELPLRQARDELVARFERHYFDALLRRTRGRIDETASLAGITPRSLYDRLRQCGLRKEDYRR